MRLAFNLASATDRFRGGTGTFVDGLLDGLARLGSAVDLVVIASPAAAAGGVWTRPDTAWTHEIVVEPAAASFGFASIGDDAAVADLVRRLAIDAWFTPHTLPAPPVLPCATIGAILDVQHEDLPELYAPRERARRALVYETLTRTSTRVVTLSAFSKGRIAARYAVDPARLDVVPLAPPTWTRLPRAAPLAVPVRPYVLYPATTWRHKNHVTLLAALAAIRARGLDVGLVLTGLEGEAHGEVRARITALALDPVVAWLGHVDEAELRALYDGAAVVAVPSRYEGFGLPVVEAMARGVPVVASQAASLGEVAGDAAILVPPLDVDAWADALGRVVTDVALVDRLRAAGAARVAAYSFEASAARLVESAERAAASGPSRVPSPRHVGPDRSFRGCCRYYVQAPTAGVLRVEGRAAWQAAWTAAVSVETPGEASACVIRQSTGREMGESFPVPTAPASLALTIQVGRGSARDRAELAHLSLRLDDGTELDLLPGVDRTGVEETLEEGLARAVVQLRGLGQRGYRRLALYGGGSHSARLIGDLAGEPVTVVAVIDDRPTMTAMAGVPVVAPAAWPGLGADAVVLSSRTFEPLLAARAATWLPAGVPLIRLYTNENR